jgi:precorrin-6x reductase
MPRFFFHLTSVNRNIADDTGKELGTLNDACDYARKLIDKILLYVGSDDVNAWKVVIFSDNHNAQIVVPFPVSCSLPTHAEGQAIQHDAGGP